MKTGECGREEAHGEDREAGKSRDAVCEEGEQPCGLSSASATAVGTGTAMLSRSGRRTPSPAGDE
jgi:hypothetical protein